MLLALGLIAISTQFIYNNYNIVSIIHFYLTRIGEFTETSAGKGLTAIFLIITGMGVKPVAKYIYLFFYKFIFYIDDEEDIIPKEHHRDEMIDLVRKNWINVLLHNPLSNSHQIELELEELPDKVKALQPRSVKLPDRVPRTLPSSSKTLDIINDLGNSFLILGDPGSGKTTLLLQIAEKFLDVADKDDRHRIPVVFNLSSWAKKRLPLEEWLVDDMQFQFGIPPSLAKNWVRHDLIFPFLDGLDEVAPEHRHACAEAINQFRKQNGLVPIIVCSRTEEYDSLNLPLNLPTAIFVKPLTRSKIETYLKEIGPSMNGVRAVLQDDDILWELLTAPFMLNVVIMAFRDKPPECIRGTGTIKERRTQIFHAYKKAMFDRPGRSKFRDDFDVKEDGKEKKNDFQQQNAEHWLTWLARSMKKQNQSIFYLEQIDFYSWLLPRQWHIMYPGIELAVPIIFGIFFGLAFGLVGFLIAGLGEGLFWGLNFWIVYTFAFFVFNLFILQIEYYDMKAEKRRLVSIKNLIKKIKKLLSRPTSESAGIAKISIIVFFGIIIGLFSGLVFTILSYVRGDPSGMDLFFSSWLFIGAISCLFLAIIYGLDGLIEREQIYKYNFPNEGMHITARNAFIMGPCIGLVIGLFFASTSNDIYFKLLWILAGLSFGVASGMFFGGINCIRHYCLRIVLMRNNSMPWDYAKFLDYSADKIFLKKIGGGYAFIHGMIMDYFASLEADAIKDKLRSIEASLINELPIKVKYLIEEAQVSRDDYYEDGAHSIHSLIYLVKTEDNKIFIESTGWCQFVTYEKAPSDILIMITDQKLQEFIKAIEENVRIRFTTEL